MLVLVLTACSPASLSLDDVSKSDTAGGGTGQDSAVDTVDTVDSADTATATDWSRFDGTRKFIIDGECDDAVEDTGTELLSGGAYDDILAAWPEAAHIYETVPSSDTACDGQLSLSTGWRALTVTGDTAEIHFYNTSGEYGSDTSAKWDEGGHRLDFGFEYSSVGISGAMEFPAL